MYTKWYEDDTNETISKIYFFVSSLQDLIKTA